MAMPLAAIEALAAELQEPPCGAATPGDQQYLALVEFLPVALIVHRQGRVVFANPAAAVLIGARSSQELLGRSILDLVHPDCRAVVAERVRSLVEHGGIAEPMEEKLIRLDGEIVEVEVTSMPTRFGGEDAVLAVARDITESKRALAERRATEEELGRAKDAALEASRLKSAFLANMSHEIRTPLNVILGYNSLVAEHLEEIGDHTQDEHFAAIHGASQRLLNTIHGILDLSKIETHAFEVHPSMVDLPAVVLREARRYEARAAAKGVALLLEIEVSAAFVWLDEYCLTEALGQLLDNAIKFTSEGTVRVRLQRGENGTLLVAVEDTGIGIDETFVSRLYEPFSQEESGYTRRYEGPGLGLTLVKKYLEMNGASIHVASRKGEGSRFEMRISSEMREKTPCSEIGAPAKAEPLRALAEGERPSVLVVEDDPVTLVYMNRLLAQHCTVLFASSGEEFREQLAQHGSELRLVLMDLSLRGPEDGLTLTRFLRSESAWRDLPVIAVTAHALEKDRENALAAGCDDYVPKPIDPRDLLLKVATACRR